MDGTCIHEWTNSGCYTVTLTAYNNDNPNGVLTNLAVNVQSALPARVQSPALLTNGFSFQFPAQTDAFYVIQYATNLIPPVSWQTLQTIFVGNEPSVQILDPSGTNAARFYQVITE